MPVQNSTCPGYQPSGYGQVTPDPIWLNNCGQCITPIAGYDWGPTPDWGDNPNEPTPTPTPTQIAVQGIDTYGSLRWNNLSTWINIPNYELVSRSFSGAYGGFYPTLIKEYPVVGAIYPANTQVSYNLNISTAFWGANSYYNMYTASVWIKFTNNKVNSAQTIYFNVDEPDAYSIQLLYNQSYTIKFWEGPGGTANSGDFNSIVHIEGTNITSDGGFFTIEINKTNIFSGSLSLDLELTRYNYLYHLIQPSPTPASDYCNIILDANASPDSGFALPEIGIGYASCFDIGGWSVPQWAWDLFFGEGTTPPTLPGIEFCFAPLTFGNIQLFNQTIELDFLAAGMAGIVLFRIITRS